MSVRQVEKDKGPLKANRSVAWWEQDPRSFSQ